MNRRIETSYSFSDREIRELLLNWLRLNEMPAPKYVGDTDDTKWIKEPDGLRVEWIEQDQTDV